MMRLHASMIVCAFCFLFILFCGCSEAAGNLELKQDAPAHSNVESQEVYQARINEKMNYIFDEDTVRTYSVLIDPDSLAVLNANPRAEFYVMGSLVFEGDTIYPVGIRYKGSEGAWAGCVSDSKEKSCTKLSMKIKINWNEKNDIKLKGLKKLQFHSMKHYHSQLRERLGYWFFREMGVPASRAVHAKLMINGEYNGLFTLVEQVDGRFTRARFDDGTGNVYKEIWPLTQDNVPHPQSTYLEKLETNKDENPTVEIMTQFADDITHSEGLTLRGVIEQWMDVQTVMNYMAVDYAIGNDDGAFHWYCFGGCGPHNFYWYEDPTSLKVHLIPWDLDFVFDDSNPYTVLKDGWGDTTSQCEPFAYGGLGWLQRSASCDKLTAGWVMYADEYAAAQQQLLEGPFAGAHAKIDQWAAQIRQATIDAHLVHDDAITEGQFDAGVSQLKEVVDAARESLEAAIEGSK